MGKPKDKDLITITKDIFLIIKALIIKPKALTTKASMSAL
jgi:hypothetical protein